MRTDKASNLAGLFSRGHVAIDDDELAYQISQPTKELVRETCGTLLSILSSGEITRDEARAVWHKLDGLGLELRLVTRPYAVDASKEQEEPKGLMTRYSDVPKNPTPAEAVQYWLEYGRRLASCPEMANRNIGKWVTDNGLDIPGVSSADRWHAKKIAQIAQTKKVDFSKCPNRTPRAIAEWASKQL